MRQKSITVRLPEEEYVAFTTICNEKGYSKTGKIREFIRNMVKTEIGEVELSAGEWEKVREGIREIERGQYATFEEMRRALGRRQLVHKQNRERGAADHRITRPGNSGKNLDGARRPSKGPIFRKRQENQG
jgi:predicted transcriptional regulator